jgi:hypothetical protein
MRRSPLLTSVPAGSEEHPFTKIDITKLRFSATPPGGLSADPPPDVSAAVHADRKKKACYDKLRADTKKFGVSDMDIYADGAADLEHYRGSLAAFAIFQGALEMNKNGDFIPPDYEGVSPAGAASCSYSAEGAAIRNALRQLVQLNRDGHISPGYARFILDSKSFIDALSLGPLQQREWLEMECYVEIAELVAAGFSLAFVFIFSHCGVLRNEYVDAICSLDNRTTATTLHHGADPLEQVPMRLCDCVNARLRGLEHYGGAPTCPFGRKDRTNRPAPLRPDCSMDKAGLSREDEILLNRVRTLACPKLGETRQGEPATQCRRCKAQVMHRKSAVWHMMECQEAAAVACRHEHGLQRRGDLAQPGKERAVLALIRLFVDQSDGREDDQE